MKTNVLSMATRANDAPSAPPREEPRAAAPPGADSPTRPRSAAKAPSRATLLARNIILPTLTFAIVIGLWAVVQNRFAPELPSPVAVWERAVEVFADPFYADGPNDMGIGWQVLYSLGRVLAGFLAAVAVGIPVGFIMGMSETAHRAWQPLVQILRPVSPLAWLPIGLLLFKAVNPSAIFVIFITSIWPVLLNTATGVRAIPKDYMNVAAVLQLRRLEIVRKILLPGSLPYVITGMRLTLGIAWMVIVAAEMLTGGIGIGFYVWDEWNNLNVASIVVAIVLIGLVGIALDLGMQWIQRRYSYASQ